MSADSFDVEIHDGLGALCGLKEGHIVPIIHKEVFGQDCGAGGVPEDVEVLLDVRISVGVVFPDLVTRQMHLRCFVQVSCQGVGFRLTDSSEAVPATSIHPLLTVTGGVDVNGDENYLVFADLLADLVYTAAALLQGDVLALRDQEPGIKAQGSELFADSESEIAVVGVFAEVAVRAPLAGSLKAVAIVGKYNHSTSSFWVSDGKLGRICKNQNWAEVGNLWGLLKKQMPSECLQGHL